VDGIERNRMAVARITDRGQWINLGPLLIDVLIDDGIHATVVAVAGKPWPPNIEKLPPCGAVGYWSAIRGLGIEPEGFGWDLLQRARSVRLRSETRTSADPKGGLLQWSTTGSSLHPHA
jgi:hypothetical protein